MSPQRTRLVADLTLLLIVAAWGYTFVPIKEVTFAWPQFWMTFVALRFWIAAVAFLPLLALPRRATPQRRAVWPGVLTGLAMLLGFSLQTAGLVYTTPSIAGFITGLSVVMIPIGARVLGRRIPAGAVIGIGIATVGLVFLCLQPETSFTLGKGELLVLGCAVSFAGQILLTDRFASSVDPVRFTAVQCLVTAIGASLYAFAFEIRGVGWPTVTAHILWTALFCGVVSSTLSFLVQTLAQRVTTATHVALIYAMEPVFAALASWWLLNEVLTSRMQVGCGLILLGMLSAELLPMAAAARQRQRLRHAGRA